MNSTNLFDLAYETLTLRRAELKATEPSRRQRKAHAAFTAALNNINAEISAANVCWHNFHDATRAVFEEVSLEVINGRQPDFVSASGSMYWRTATGVYRLSDHWGLGIRSCDWYLRRRNGSKDAGYTTALAFCAYKHFQRDVAGKTRYWMVSPDGSEKQCLEAQFVKKGFSMRTEVVVASVYHTYETCCAVKVTA